MTVILSDAGPSILAFSQDGSIPTPRLSPISHIIARKSPLPHPISTMSLPRIPCFAMIFPASLRAKELKVAE